MSNHKKLMADHIDLQKLSPSERIKIAKKNRMKQLQRWADLEKDWKKEQKRRKAITKERASWTNGVGHKRLVKFEDCRVLIDAAVRNDTAEVKRLVNSKKLRINAKNEDGLTALHQACVEGLDSMVRLLIELGADINAVDNELWTPLHCAAACATRKCCQALCESGANILAINADLNMPYDICEDEATLDFLENEMLRQQVTQEQIDRIRSGVERQMLTDLQAQYRLKADLNEIRDPFGATPLHIAVANGFAEVAQWLLSHGAATGVRDLDSWTPMHAAAYWGQEAMIELLLLHNDSLEVRTQHQETAYDLCPDPDLKAKILELAEDVKQKRFQKIQGNFRESSARSSQAVGVQRSTSVRRTNMHDKNRLSLKDVKQQAKMMMAASPLGSMDDLAEENGLDLSFTGSVESSSSTLTRTGTAPIRGPTGLFPPLSLETARPSTSPCWRHRPRPYPSQDGEALLRRRPFKPPLAS